MMGSTLMDLCGWKLCLILNDNRYLIRSMQQICIMYELSSELPGSMHAVSRELPGSIYAISREYIGSL